MGYAILRIQKLKSAVAVHRSLKHAFREQDTPNADPERTPDNDHHGATSAREGMAAFRARLPERFRKDAVQCVEYLLTASPEDMKGKSRQQQDAYFADALTWLKAKHGAENVVYAGVHRDETTPHMYAYVVPRVGDKLNAKAFFGGAKALNALQTDFAAKVGQKHGLQRGLERSKARHQTIREYYAKTAAATPPRPSVEIPEPSMSERMNPKAYGVRVANEVIAQVNPVFGVAYAKAAEVDMAKKQAKEARAAQADLAKRLSPVVMALGPLTPTERNQLAAQMTEVSRQMVLARTAAEQENRRKAEVAKRAGNLKQLERNSPPGTARLFAKLGQDAIKQAGGNVDQVNWAAVEIAAATTAIQERNESHSSAALALIKYSPGAVDERRHDQIRSFVSQISLGQDKAPRSTPGQDLDHSR
jgi:hypothetical protein